MILIPLIAEARKPKEKPLVFVVDESLSKPKIIYRPYASEFKKLPPKIKREVQPKVRNKTENKRSAKPKSPAKSSGESYGAGEIQDLIRKYAQQFGINPATPLCIAKGESEFDPKAISPSGKYHGVFQYDLNTWKGTDEAKVGMHVLDGNANVKAAVKFMAIHTKRVPATFPSTSKKCPPVTPIN